MDKIEFNIDLKTFLIFLLNKINILLFFICMGFGYATFSYYKTTKVYTANATVSIGKLDSAEDYKMPGMDSMVSSKDKIVNNELFILKTYDFLKRVSEKSGSRVRYYKKIFYINEYLSFYKELNMGAPIEIFNINGELFDKPQKIFFTISEDGTVVFSQAETQKGRVALAGTDASFDYNLSTNEKGSYFITIDPQFETIETIKNRIKISKTVKDSNIVSIEYHGHQEERTLGFLKLYLETYFEEYGKRSSYDIDEKLKYLQAQKELLNQQFSESLKEILNFQESENLASTKTLAQNETQLLVANEEELFKTKLDTMQLEKTLQSVKLGLFSNLVNLSTYNHADISPLNQTLSLKKNELTSLLVDYTEKHPAVVAKKAEIESVKNDIKSAIERNIENNKIIIQGLQEHISAKTEKLRSIPKNEMILNNLQKKMELNDKLLLAITEKEFAISINKKKINEDFTILESPRITTYPPKITSASVYMKPLAFFLLLSMISGVLLYAFEKKIYSIYQLVNFIKIKKSFIFKTDVMSNLEEFKNIFYYILSDNISQRCFYVVAPHQKLALKFAFFIAKFSMKKTILVHIDDSKRAIQHILHDGYVDECLADKIVLEYMEETVIKCDMAPEVTKNDFVDIAALKSILFKHYDIVVFHAKEELHHMDSDDIVIFNFYKKHTELKFVNKFVEYAKKKKISQIYALYFLEAPKSNQTNENRDDDDECECHNQMDLKSEKNKEDTLALLEENRKRLFRLHDEMKIISEQFDAHIPLVLNSSEKLNLQGLLVYCNKSEDELKEIIAFIDMLRERAGEKDEMA